MGIEIAILVATLILIVMVGLSLNKKSNPNRSFNSQFREQRQEVNSQFKNGFDSLSQQLKLMVDLQRDELGKQTKSIGDSFNKLTSANDRQLANIQETVDKRLETTIQKQFRLSFKQVSELLNSVQDKLSEIDHFAKEVDSLQKTLTNVSSRGAWGEAQLGNLLSEILNSNQYDTNVVTKKGSRDRVEFAIKLPSKDNQLMYLPIDAKFPLTIYEKLQEAIVDNDKAAMATARKELTKRLKQESKKIQDKYLDPPTTTDFVGLYLPSEGLFAEAVQQPGLVDELRRDHKIIVLGPTTIIAALSVIQMGYQTLKIQSKTGEMWQTMSDIQKHFYKFQDLLLKASKKIDEAKNVIESASSKSRNITSKLNRIGDQPPDDVTLDTIGAPTSKV